MDDTIDRRLAQRLEAESAVRRILAAYCQACDDGRFDDLAQLFSDDIELVVRGSVVARGRTSARDWVAAAQPPERRGLHVTSNAVIAVTDAADEASSRADFVFYVRGPEGLVPARTGRYEDRCTPAPDGRGWLLARREMLFRP